jgi:hypothetical protein
VKVKNKTQSAGTGGQPRDNARDRQVEIRGQRSDVRGQQTDDRGHKAEILLWERLSSHDLDWDFTDFTDLNDLNDIDLYVIKTLPKSDGVKNPCR